jgi:hypothetical protein
MLTHVAPLAWAGCALYSKQVDTWNLIESTAYLYGLCTLLFLAERRYNSESRVNFLKDQMNKRISVHDQHKLQKLQKKVENIESVLPSEEFFCQLVKCSQAKAKQPEVGA